MKDEIIYVGEHTWAGNLGNAFISLAFASALFACITYLVAHFKPEQKGFKPLARTFFSIHAFSVFGIIGTIFYMMLNHYYEFTYVWTHTNSETETRYLFAAFWEGQEGSFLLWTFWHAVIGIVLMLTSKKWESPVVATLAFVQVFLCLMVMGIYIGDVNVGTNPFTLLRENAQNQNIPVFSQFEIGKDGLKYNHYVDKIGKTARGLNPLLKNYWMTIHPPTLFLGFALTVVPFCFSVAGLLTRKHKEWQKTALPWGYTGVLILGTGILMGGAWAYEALSFGGFWAWDPVENASFVPWLTLVGAAHLMMINKATGQSVFSTYIFSISTFVLVLYSTFLTRSGILGDSSVHAFTDLGMENLLILFLMVFIMIPVSLMIKNKMFAINYFLLSALFLTGGIFGGHLNVAGLRTTCYLVWAGGTLIVIFYEYFKNWLPVSDAEESAWSREFWIFIGALVLFLFAGAVAVCTSFPVINKMFGSKLSLTDNGLNFYNVIGIIGGIFILALVGISHYFKYRKTNMEKWGRNFIFSGLLTFAFFLVVLLKFFNRGAWENSSLFQRTTFFIAPILVFFALFALFANLEYWLRVLKGKIKNAGGAIAHAGFALVMIGCVVSNSGKRVISKNTSDKDISSLGKKFSNNTNILLAKGDTLKMGSYLVTYKGKKKEGINIFYEVEYYKNENGKKDYQFTLRPRIQLNERMGNAPEPDTRHFWGKDVYTDVTYAELSSPAEIEGAQGWSQTENNIIHLHDSIVTNEYILILDSLKTSMTEEEFKKQDSLLVVTAVFSAYDMQKNVRKLYPRYILKNREVAPEEFIDDQLGLKLVFWKINPEEGSVEITLSEKLAKKKDFIVMEAFEFPWINVLWIGCFVMIIGTALAVFHRIRQNLRSRNEA
jgi:cytochrome c-type biogenesis protein CcmF